MLVFHRLLLTFFKNVAYLGIIMRCVVPVRCITPRLGMGTGTIRTIVALPVGVARALIVLTTHAYKKNEKGITKVSFFKFPTVDPRTIRMHGIRSMVRVFDGANIPWPEQEFAHKAAAD